MPMGRQLSRCVLLAFNCVFDNGNVVLMEGAKAFEREQDTAKQSSFVEKRRFIVVGWLW